MGKIDELIKQFCPDGVKSAKLGDICNILDSKRKPITKGKRIRGNCPYYGANGIQDYVDGYLFDGIYLLLGEDGSVINNDKSPVLNWAVGKIWVNNHAHILSEKKEDALLRYLYYALQTCDVSSIVRGTPPKINQANLRNIEIPLPPLAVQKEIVEILDAFTGMIDNLQKELEQRQKQFEHYRDQLLTFKEDECKYSKLADVCEVINGRAYKQSELLSDGKYRVLRVGNFFSNDSWYYSNLELDDKNYCQKGDLLYAWSASFGPRIWKEEKVVFHYHIWKMACSDGLDRVFFYYWLQSHDMERQVSSGKHGATMAHLTKKLMESLMIPVPSLETQQEIVDKLDTFEALISNIKQEIELRQKQYEYYREKLLTFE